MARGFPANALRSSSRSIVVSSCDTRNGQRGVALVHSRFLRELAQRLIARPDIFRTLLGPVWPGHKNHFHLDMALYRVVEIF